MRVFIAVDIDQQVKTVVTELQERIRRQAAIEKKDASWVGPEAMHLTLKFLGEINDRQVVEVCKTAEEVSGRHNSFELDIEGAGSFGGRSARVLWIGTGAGGDSLHKLAEDIEQSLAAGGFPEERRRFAGHLTLCRIKNAKAGMQLGLIAKNYENFKAGTTLIDSVTVYQSHLKPTGPEYIVLGRYKLTG